MRGQQEWTDSKGHVALSDVKTLLGSPNHLRAEPRLLATTFRATFSKPLSTHSQRDHVTRIVPQRGLWPDPDSVYTLLLLY